MDSLTRKPKKKQLSCKDRSLLNCSKYQNINNSDFNINPSIEDYKKESWNKKRFFKKIIIFLFLITIVAIISVGIFFFWKIDSVSSKISSHNESSKSIITTISKIAKKDRVALKGEDIGRINVLLLGVAGKGKAGGNLTDTIMIASIDTQNNKTALLSLPRDFYVEIPNSQYSTKINSIYKYGLTNDLGVDSLKKTVEEITGLPINYYLIASFAGFEKFIDDIDGVVVQVERDIYDPTYPGPNYSYELFAIEKGTHLLDGSTALKYARERHDDPQGDFGRAKRQQQILQATKSRIFSTKVLFNPFTLNNILNTLGDSIVTDISLEEMESFLQLSKNLDTQNINNMVIDSWKKDSLLKVSHIFYKDVRAFILVPRVGNYSEIQDLAQNIFNLDKLKKRAEEIKKEEASILIINRSGQSQLLKKIEKLLKEKMNLRDTKNIKSKSDLVLDTTKIIDLTNGQKPFTLDELIKKLPARNAVAGRPARNGINVIDENSFDLLKLNDILTNYDLIIIIGSDLIEPYSYEENTIEEMLENQNDLDNKEILIKK